MSSQSAFASAADALAGSVLGALTSASDTAHLARHVDDAPDALAALAAVRVIGADTFAPNVLAGAPLDAQDAAVVAKSFETFPAPGAGSQDPVEQRTTAWRDWATARLLDQLGSDGTPRIDAPPPRDDDVLTATADWRTWTDRMAQLAPLAILGIEGPVHAAARVNALTLSRGVSRAILIRDIPTAVRLIRWLAWLRYEGVELPLDPELVAEHVWLVGGTGARTALDLAVARQLLARAPSAPPSAVPCPVSDAAKPPVDIPEPVTGAARTMTERALSWLHANREHDPLPTVLSETALAASLVLRDGVAGPGRLAVAQSLMDFTWEQLGHGDALYGCQLAGPLAPDPLEMYAPFVRCGYRHEGLDRLLAHRTRIRSATAVGMPPGRRLAAVHAARIIGLDPGRDSPAALTRATWLGVTPEPWCVNPATAHAMTRTVFHLTDWGADPRGLPPALASYVCDWLPVWTDTTGTPPLSPPSRDRSPSPGRRASGERAPRAPDTPPPEGCGPLGYET